MIPKKLALINDLAGFGRCSLTVSLPVISTLKVQACPVPTSVFSNHTGFPDWYAFDFTKHLPAYLDKWAELGFCFDGVYCGYLGSERQIDIVSEFILSQKQNHALILIDPVMGDHGKTYSGISDACCRRMKELIHHAHILTPNLTEACLLTDIPYEKAQKDESCIPEMLASLHEMGPSQVVITGVQTQNQLANYISDKNTSSFCTYKTPVAGQARHGTGDLFASILAADCLNGSSLTQAVKKAADFISLCIAGAEKDNVPLQEGICFENYLSALIPQ